MNLWAQMLADAPPTLQRLIASAQRVSMPRGATPAVRLARLRLALCHARTVRVTYFAQPPDLQAAVQQLRTCRGGLSVAALAARFGPIRPWSQIAQDRAPRSLSERLVLLGWLLPRPAAQRHPPHFLLPPEVRRWLPRPLALADQGDAPPPPPPLARRAAVTILLACAERPLPLRHDGRLRAESLRRLTPRLAPLDAEAVAALCCFTLPLLIDLDLLAPHGAAAALAPAGARFLTQDAERQFGMLRAAWVRAPQLDAWLRPLLVDQRGLDLPLLRRRLLIWAAALPTGRLLAAAPLYDALAAALGPLADAQTHGFRTVDRAPWQPKRAAAVWDAALRGPLTWLGSVAWDDTTSQCFATPTARMEVVDADELEQSTENRAHSTPDHVPATAMQTESVVHGRSSRATDHELPTTDHGLRTTDHWQYGAPGEVRIPHAALGAAVLRLLPYARWHAADACETSYRVTPRTLAAASAAGHSADALWALLDRQAGPLPAGWCADLPATHDTIRIIHTAVALSDNPAVLARAATARSVRRYLEARLAPGIALVDPTRASALARVLEQRDLAVERRGDPRVARPAAFSPAECATLLAALGAYHHSAPESVSPDALAQLEQRLRAALPHPLRIATAPLPPPPIVAPVVGRATQAQPDAEQARAVQSSADVPGSLGAPGATDYDLRTMTHAPQMTAHAPAAPDVIAPATQRARPALLAPLLAAALALWLLLGVLLRGGRRPRAVAAGPLSPGPVARDAAPARPAPVGNLPVLRRAIARREVLEISYQSAEAATATTRIIWPLRLEGHGACWYLHAYCTLRQAERVFRLDRIGALTVLGRPARRRGGLDRRKQRPPPEPQAASPCKHTRRPATGAGTGFFPPPPDAPPGSPLVRIWLVEE